LLSFLTAAPPRRFNTQRGGSYSFISDCEVLRMKIAICPGSFDPITRGHLDIIERTAQMFDQVIVLVLVNPAKKYLLSQEERASFARRAVAHLPNVKVESYTGLVAEFAAQVGATALVKGLRAVTDFEYETQQALTNKMLNPQLETLFMISGAKYLYLSSSTVKEILRFSGNAESSLPPAVSGDLQALVTNRLQWG